MNPPCPIDPSPHSPHKWLFGLTRLDCPGVEGTPPAPNNPNKDQWVTSRTLAEFLIGHQRDNDVKVLVNGILVPIIGLGYDPRADAITITLDEGGIDYRAAMA